MSTSRYARRPRLRFSSQPCTTFPQLRHVTVGTLVCRHVSIPWIRLRGQWLKQAGFAPRSSVAIVVTPGRLELTVVTQHQAESRQRNEDGCPE